jgi:spore photoproduct lyase
MKPFKAFSADRTQRDTPAARRLEGRGEQILFTEEPPRTNRYRHGKRRLHLTSKRGEAFDYCASMDPRYICCRIHVLRALSNCPCECSYCFLQNYLTDATTWVVSDTPALLEEVERKMAREPWRFFRVGTWELGDSLALEPLLGTAAELVVAFARKPNALLDLRTKTDFVDGLLELDHGGRTVVSWTMNPESVVKSEELRTASVARRLDAMARVARAGYPVGVHFDPVIVHEGWEGAYNDLVERIFRAVPAARIPWISVGSLRFNPEMKKKIEENYPRSRITSAEMVPGDDGKMRYVKPLRLALYRHLYRAIRQRAPEDVFVYLCMERPDVWKRVFGRHPRSGGHLDYLLTESLYRRYPGLVHERPDRALYDPPGL